jgi:hypothetical protein
MNDDKPSNKEIFDTFVKYGTINAEIIWPRNLYLSSNAIDYLPENETEEELDSECVY